MESAQAIVMSVLAFLAFVIAMGWSRLFIDVINRPLLPVLAAAMHRRYRREDRRMDRRY